MRECIDTVEDAFIQHARGALPVSPGVLGAHLQGGGFHVKTAALGGDRGFFAAKVNANFPGNPASHGLPTIQGMIALFDLANGRPLALLDSIEITILRTAAASAVAARNLARHDASRLTIIGCGAQGRSHLRALSSVRPLSQAYLFDTDSRRAEQLAADLRPELDFELTPTADLPGAITRSDILVTCTPAHTPVLTAAMFRSGLFVAAVGADNPDKQEIDPGFLRKSRVVVDLPGQAAAMGDLRHAIEAGVMTVKDIHATLGEIAAGLRPGGRSADETFVFDSTGTALQDVAAASVVYRKALETGRGTGLELA